MRTIEYDLSNVEQRNAYSVDRLTLWRAAWTRLIGTMSADALNGMYCGLNGGSSQAAFAVPDHLMPETLAHDQLVAGDSLVDETVVGVRAAMACMTPDQIAELESDVIGDHIDARLGLTLNHLLDAEDAFVPLLALDAQLDELEFAEGVEDADEDEDDDLEDDDVDGTEDEGLIDEDEDEDESDDQLCEGDAAFAAAASLTSAPVADGTVYTAVVSDLGTLSYALGNFIDVLNSRENADLDLAAPVHGPNVDAPLYLTMLVLPNAVTLQLKQGAPVPLHVVEG